jgi:hypothetical protein
MPLNSDGRIYQTAKYSSSLLRNPLVHISYNFGYINHSQQGTYKRTF